MSIFKGTKSLRHKFSALTFTQLAAASDKASSVLLHRFDMAGYMVFIDNATDVDLALYLVHPDGDSADPDFKLFWLEIPATRVINYQTGTVPGLFFDPGTRVYASYLTAAPTLGKIRMPVWG
jgi:hypothetical protein